MTPLVHRRRGRFARPARTRRGRPATVGITPAADIRIGHRSATVCHLGNIAVRTGKTIHWDPKTEAIVGDDETARWLTKEYRKPYTLS